MSKKKHEWTRKGVTASMAVVLAFGMMPAVPGVAWATDGTGEAETVVSDALEDASQDSAVTLTIGGVPETCSSLEEAMTKIPDAAEAAIRLNDDIVVSSPCTVKQGQTVVLDLNGHAITVSDGFVARVFVNNGNLTIKGDGSVDVSAAGANGYGTVNNFGVLTVEDGTYTNLKESTASNFYNRDGAVATFGNVTVHGGGGCIATAKDTVTTINGGYYENETFPAIENRGAMLITAGEFVNTSCSSCSGNWGYTVRSGESSDVAKLTLQGKTDDAIKVTGVQGGLAVIGGTAEVHNGAYETKACGAHSSGASSFYAGYFTGESYKTATTIYGGSFKSCTKTAVLVGNGNPAPDSGAGEESTVIVHGGSFVGGDAAKTAISVNSAQHAIGGAKIYGGRYSSNPHVHVAPGHKSEEKESMFEVSKVVAAVEPSVRPAGTASDGLPGFDYAKAYEEAGVAVEVADGSASMTVDEAKLEAFVNDEANEEKKAALTKSGEDGGCLSVGLAFPTPELEEGVASKVRVLVDGVLSGTVDLGEEADDSVVDARLVRYFAFAKEDGTLLEDAKWDVALEWLDGSGRLVASSEVTVSRESVKKPAANPGGNGGAGGGVPGGGTGGGSTVPSVPEGEVTENPDGSTTTTVTEEGKNDDGSTVTTVTETTAGREDGSTTEKVTETTVSSDGSIAQKVTETNTLKDGTSVTTVSNDGALTSVEATVSQAAVEAAGGKAVGLPMAPVQAVSSDKAVEMKVKAPTGSKVAVPVAKAQGETSIAPGAVLVVVDAEGNETVLPKTANDGSSLSAKIPGDCALKVVDASVRFPDIREGDWYGDQGVVDFVSARGIMTGVGAGPDAEFQGDMATNRGMFVTMLHRLEMEAKAESSDGFADVAPDSWYAGSAAWAVEAGVATGCLGADGNAVFDGDGKVTREQMATFLFRYAQWLGMDTSARVEGEIEGVSDFAKNALSWAVAEGLIQGDGGTGALRPGDGATRAEAAVVVMRMIGLMA